MIREHIAQGLDHDPNFRWRGEAVTRIENLSDIVFALTLGIIVSASASPQTYDELWPHLWNIFPVTAAFAMMLTVWNHHFTFFRRYGVADKKIIALNAILLLLVLFIAHPLWFAFDSLFAFILGSLGDWRRMNELGIETVAEAGNIIAVVSVGLTAIYFFYHAMYSYALKKSDVLNLSNSEIAITRRSIWRYRVEVLMNAAIAVLAVFTILGPFAAFLGILNRPFSAMINKKIKLPDEQAPVME